MGRNLCLRKKAQNNIFEKQPKKELPKIVNESLFLNNLKKNSYHFDDENSSQNHYALSMNLSPINKAIYKLFIPKTEWNILSV